MRLPPDELCVSIVLSLQSQCELSLAWPHYQSRAESEKHRVSSHRRSQTYFYGLPPPVLLSTSWHSGKYPLIRSLIRSHLLRGRSTQFDSHDRHNRWTPSRFDQPYLRVCTPRLASLPSWRSSTERHIQHDEPTVNSSMDTQ